MKRSITLILAWFSLSVFNPVTGFIVETGKCHRCLSELRSSRRDVLAAAIGSMLLATSTAPANSFSNKISTKYDDRPKRRGPQPKDLGISTRVTLEGDEYDGLKGCGISPNCFSSSLSLDDDPDHSIPAWKYPSSYDQNRAFDELKAAIEAYRPGQNGVDGGGFEIKTFDAKKGYLYVQFEALKNGYIDDFEVATLQGGQETRAVQVRSSSRVGYLDYGVNAKRLNYIAEKLREKGWDAEGVNVQTHRRYAIENETV